MFFVTLVLRLCVKGMLADSFLCALRNFFLYIGSFESFVSHVFRSVLCDNFWVVSEHKSSHRKCLNNSFKEEFMSLGLGIISLLYVPEDVFL